MRSINLKLLLPIILAMSLLVGVVLYIFYQNDDQLNTVAITNIQICSRNIDPATLNDLEKTVYGIVKVGNDYNKKQTAKHYEATIREKSCETKNFTVKTSSGKKSDISNSTILIDIPKAEQSWIFSYDWFVKDSPVDTGINGATPKCPTKEQLKYGDFNCERILSLGAYDTDRVDPILQYMPYYGAGFRLEYNPDTKTVSVIILPPPGTKDVAAFTENTKAIIPYWFQKRGLDQSKYRVLYNSNIVDD